MPSAFRRERLNIGFQEAWIKGSFLPLTSWPWENPLQTFCHLFNRDNNSVCLHNGISGREMWEHSEKCIVTRGKHVYQILVNDFLKLYVNILEHQTPIEPCNIHILLSALLVFLWAETRLCNCFSPFIFHVFYIFC